MNLNDMLLLILYKKELGVSQRRYGAPYIPGKSYCFQAHRELERPQIAQAIWRQSTNRQIGKCKNVC